MPINSATAKVMLILNLTPDSFSDGGKYFNQPASVIDKINLALTNGITTFDIGAESTRPQAQSISIDEEIYRLTPVINKIHKLRDIGKFTLSLDSYKPGVIEYFLDKIDIINDVSNRIPLALIAKITNLNKKYVLMHSLTVPANPQINLNCTEYNVTDELLNWFQQRLDDYTHHQINTNNIILDPGIGFNKTAAQSWQLLREINQFKQFNCQLLVGHSRKSFLNSITQQKFANRDWESAIISSYLNNNAIDYIRMHEYEQFITLTNINQKLQPLTDE